MEEALSGASLGCSRKFEAGLRRNQIPRDGVFEASRSLAVLLRQEVTGDSLASEGSLHQAMNGEVTIQPT